MQIYVHKTNYAIKIKIMNNINKKQKKKKWLWKPDLYLTSINLQNEKKKIIKSSYNLSDIVKFMQIYTDF